MLGMHGAYSANMAVSNCDLLLAVGVRFDDRSRRRSSFAPAPRSSISISIRSPSTDHPDDLSIVKPLRTPRDLHAHRREGAEAGEQPLGPGTTGSANGRRRFALLLPPRTSNPVRRRKLISHGGRAIVATEVARTDVGAQFYRLTSRSLPHLGRLRHDGVRAFPQHRAQVACPGPGSRDVARRSTSEIQDWDPPHSAYPSRS